MCLPPCRPKRLNDMLTQERLFTFVGFSIESDKEKMKMFGLPVSCSDVNVKDVVKAMELDKKVKGKAVRWVLLEGIGRPVIRQDVPKQAVAKVLEELLSNA